MQSVRTDDLLALVSSDVTLKRVATTNGGEYAGPCPFCGGTDRFRVWPTPPHDEPRWWCRQCNKSGDTIAYLVERGAITPAEAGRLRHDRERSHIPVPHSSLPSSAAQEVIADASPPPGKWQAQALRNVTQCEEQLRTKGNFALGEVRDWGLSDDTIRQWHLGWCPGGQHPRGIVIPHFACGRLWALKTRRYEGNVPAGAPKYTQLQGGRTILFGVDRLRGTNRTLLLAEGEKDAVLAWQELGDLVDVASLAGATKAIPPRWAMYLLPYDHILVAYDADSAGQGGAARLTAHVRSTQSLTLAAGHDIVDMHQQGHDLRAWLRFYLDRLGIVPGWRPIHPTEPEPGTHDKPDGLGVSRPRECDVAEAQRLGSLYWVLRPLSEWNGRLDKLAQNLELCRQWAEEHGVLDVLEQALEDVAPRGTPAPR